MEEQRKRIVQKIEFYYGERLKCHIDKFSGEWLNGYFDRKATDEVWVFKEDKLGEIRVFVNDIADINDFRPKKEEVKNGD